MPVDRPFYLDAESLTSKWGFGDGDAFDDWWWDTYDDAPPGNSDDILYALVLEYLVPAMRERGWYVVIERISTIHNPVRASTLNGQQVDHYDGRTYFDLPIEIALPREQIELLIQRLTLRPAPPPAQLGSTTMTHRGRPQE